MERDITHILERDGDRVAELRDRMRTEISDFGYLVGAEVLGRWRPNLTHGNRETLAVIAVGALINYKRTSWTLGAAPLGVGEDALIAAWVDVCMSAIERDATSGS